MEKPEWFVIYTKSKSEKKVNALLIKKGIETYCPLVTSIRQWSDRKVKIEVPVFNSYVFVKIPHAQYNQVRTTPGVVNFIYWQGKPAVVRDKEMEALRNFIRDYHNLSFTLSQLLKGNKFIIPSGIFKDQPAIIQTIKKNKVILELINLQLRLEVKIGKKINLPSAF